MVREVGGGGAENVLQFFIHRVVTVQGHRSYCMEPESVMGGRCLRSIHELGI